MKKKSETDIPRNQQQANLHYITKKQVIKKLENQNNIPQTKKKPPHIKRTRAKKIIKKIYRNNK